MDIATLETLSYHGVSDQYGLSAERIVLDTRRACKGSRCSIEDPNGTAGNLTFMRPGPFLMTNSVVATHGRVTSQCLRPSRPRLRPLVLQIITSPILTRS